MFISDNLTILALFAVFLSGYSNFSAEFFEHQQLYCLTLQTLVLSRLYPLLFKLYHSLYHIPNFTAYSIGSCYIWTVFQVFQLRKNNLRTFIAINKIQYEKQSHRWTNHQNHSFTTPMQCPLKCLSLFSGHLSQAVLVDYMATLFLLKL